MKGKICVVLGLSFLMCFMSASIWAQTEKDKVQLFAVWDDVVHPSKFLEHEAACKAWVAFAAKYDFPVPINTYRTNDFHVYMLMPIDKMGDFDKFESFWAEAGKTMGKEFEEDYGKLEKLFSGTYESQTFGVIALRKDLIYTPENPRVTTEDMNYFQWNFYFIKSGKDKEAEALAKEWHELHKKNGISDGYNVFQTIMWSDMPAMLSVIGARSEADLVSHNADNAAKMGEGYSKVFKKTMDLCRSFEIKRGKILRECSYVPKK